MLVFVTVLNFQLVRFQLVWIPLNGFPRCCGGDMLELQETGDGYGSQLVSFVLELKERSLKSNLFVVICGQELLPI